MEDLNVDISRTSKINSGMLINLRLDLLWKDAHRHSRNANYSAWNSDLDRVWCELAADVVKNSEVDQIFKEINQKIGETGEMKMSTKPSGFRGYTKQEVLIHTKQYQLIMEKEIFLRRLMNEQGKGTAYDERVEDYMD